MMLERAIRLVVRLAFPRAFRQRYGRDLVIDAVARARARGGDRRWPLTYHAWILLDLLRAGFHLRLEAVEWRSGHETGSDLAFALRSLRKSPTFTITVVSVLGLGIAACVLAAAATKAYLFTAVPLPAADRLATVEYWTLPGGQGLDPWGAPANLREVDWTPTTSFVEVSLMSRHEAFAIAGLGQPTWLDAARVSSGFFTTLGKSPALGRYFDEGSPEDHAVISHRIWTTQFGRASDVLGRTVRAYPAGNPGPPVLLTIAGVLPADAWLPSGIPDLVLPLRGQRPPDLVRLRPGVDTRQATDQLAALVASQSTTTIDPRWQPKLELLTDEYRSRGGSLAVLILAVLTLMGIALVNAATLVRVRSEGRRTEFATRRALGAPAGRLRLHLFAESAVLVGGASLLAALAVRLGSVPLGTLLQTRLGPMPGGPEALRSSWEQLVVVGLGLILVTATLAAVAGATLREARIGGQGLRSRASRTSSQDVLIGVQAGLSVAVLVLGALIAHSAMKLARVDMGYTPDRAFAVEIPLHSDAYAERGAQLAFQDRFLDELRAFPGIESAAVMARSVEFDVESGLTVLDERGAEALHRAVVTAVDEAFFETLKIPVEQGRGIAASDDARSEPVVVVGRSFAEAAWPQQNPVGARIRLEDRSGEWLTVVGVVGDVREHVIREDLPNVYVSYYRNPASWSTVMVRSTLSLAAVTRSVRQALRGIDPTLPVWDLRPMSLRVDRPAASTRFWAGLLGALAAVSLALTTWGVYGNVAYRVERLGRDIRIRMALGARPTQVATAVAGRTIRFAVLGVLGGTLTAAAGARIVEAQLYGVGSHDLGTYLVVTIGGLCVVVLAALSATRRARRIPLSTLD